MIKEQGGEVRITDEGFVLKKIIQLSEMDSLEKHLIHLGILLTENILHPGKMSEYDSNEGLWILF